jgi:hypothetical protein
MSRGLSKFVLAVTILCAPAVMRAEEKPSDLSPVAAAQTNSAEIQARPAVIVKEFSANERTAWPYDFKQMQQQSIAELRSKCGSRLDVLIGDPATPRKHTYTLEGEIMSWHPGNRAKRMVIGMGSGRESADIRYWLTDENGRKIFEHKDTIRAEFWGNAYAGSVGELAHPFASKIADRLTESKLF